ACDVSLPEQVERAFAEVSGGLGGLDGLVAAAGVGDESGDVVSTSLEVLGASARRQPDRRPALLPVPLLRAAGGGSIVHVASQLALVGTRGSVSYCAAKGGVVALARAMALDHAPEAI